MNSNQNNKYLTKVASFLSGAGGALKAVGRVAKGAASEVWNSALDAGGRGVRQTTNDLFHGSNASASTLMGKGGNPRNAYRSYLKANRTPMPAGLTGDARTKEVLNRINARQDAGKMMNGVQMPGIDAKTPLRDAAKASAEAKVKTVGYAGGILYAGNKIHNKINEMRDASNQQDQQYYYQ